MFLGISYVATHITGIAASDERSIVAEIALAVFGTGIGFFLVQLFTAAILILAANTAYQDFPRLASILARDRFMPRQFVNRGDRLVFSNGVIALGVLSSVMIYVYDARLDALIHLYVSGCSRRSRCRSPAWFATGSTRAAGGLPRCADGGGRSPSTRSAR